MDSYGLSVAEWQQVLQDCRIMALEREVIAGGGVGREQLCEVLNLDQFDGNWGQMVQRYNDALAAAKQRIKTLSQTVAELCDPLSDERKEWIAAAAAAEEEARNARVTITRALLDISRACQAAKIEEPTVVAMLAAYANLRMRLAQWPAENLSELISEQLIQPADELAAQLQAAVFSDDEIDEKLQEFGEGWKALEFQLLNLRQKRILATEALKRFRAFDEIVDTKQVAEGIPDGCFEPEKRQLS